jgi:hypothetical protein
MLAADLNVEVRQLGLTDVDTFRAVRLASLVDCADAFGETLEQTEQTDRLARTRTVVEAADRAAFMAILDGVAPSRWNR